MARRPDPGDADGAIVGARVHTLDERQPIVDAVAWRRGVIVAVGADDVRAATGPRTDVVDGAGLTVYPGFTDAHLHPFFGTRNTRGVDLRTATTLDEVRRRVAQERKRCAPGEWVLAHSVRYEPFDASGITAATIDEAVGDAPALVSFFDIHTALASTAALARAGVDGSRRFDELAEVVCDEHGRPTGALLEPAAIELVRSHVPPLDASAQLAAFAGTLRALSRVGLTGAHVMLGGPELIDVCRELEARDELPLRLLLPVHQSPDVTDDEVARRLRMADERGHRWRTGTAKFFLDGVMDTGTAWLVDPGPGGVNAAALWRDLDRYAQLVRAFTEAGFAVATHAVGDGAVRRALDAYEAAGMPRRGQHRVEHIETLTDDDLPRFAALDVAASMQPLHMEGLDDPSTPSAWTDNLSAGRLPRGFRSADLAASGATIALGSDWPVADFDPLVGMAWAVLRRAPGRPDRTPYLPDQALSVQQALLGYTRGPATVAGDAGRLGRTAVGTCADLTVLGAGLEEVHADELPATPVALTVVGGTVTHRGAGLS